MKIIILLFVGICFSQTSSAQKFLINVDSNRFLIGNKFDYRLEAHFVKQSSNDFIENGSEYKMELYAGSKRVSVKKFNYKKFSPLFSGDSKDPVENKNMQPFYNVNIYILTNKKPNTIKLFHKDILIKEAKVTED